MSHKESVCDTGSVKLALALLLGTLHCSVCALLAVCKCYNAAKDPRSNTHLSSKHLKKVRPGTTIGRIAHAGLSVPSESTDNKEE